MENQPTIILFGLVQELHWQSWPALTITTTEGTHEAKPATVRAKGWCRYPAVLENAWFHVDCRKLKPKPMHCQQFSFPGGLLCLISHVP